MVTCTGHIGIHEGADGRTDGKCEKVSELQHCFTWVIHVP